MTAPGHWTEATWIELDEVDSTNAEAMRRALDGARGPLYVRAERQTEGRGRSGRSWVVPEGNLAMSRLGVVGCAPAQVPQLSLVAGLAVHRAAAWALEGGKEPSGPGGGLVLKWPNDLMLDGAKLGGILIEGTQVGAVLMAVIGIGLNTTLAPEVAGRRTAALAPAAPRMGSPRAFASLVARHLEEVLEQWDDGRGFAAVRAAWMAVASPIGTEMSVETPQGRIAGRFGGLDFDGALLLRDDQGGVHRYTYGDVTLASEREMS